MTKKSINEIRSNFRHLIEYVTPDTVTVDEGDPNAMGTGPNAMGGGPDAMGGGPSAMGGGPDAMGGDPSAMGGGPDAMGGSDPSAMGGDPSAMGADPNAMGGEAQPPEGFQPQGVDQNGGLDGMGSDPSAMGGEVPGPNDNVIEIDDLTDSQEETEKKIDDLSSKFSLLMKSIDGIEQRINDIDAHTNQYIGSLKGEMERRNPTPMQRLTMRSTKSAPYDMTPNEYMNNYAPDNYSDEPDNNGADDPQYKITKGDVDDFVDYNSIAKDIANNKVGLKDIFGY